MMNQWKHYITKSALSFSDDGSTFTLENGQTLSHVVREWNRNHPDNRISLSALRAANPGVRDTAYRAGRAYRMPSAQAAPAPSTPAAASNQAQNAPASAAPDAAPTAEDNERNAYPGRLNNPGNMEYRQNNGWPGQVGRGGRDERFARYDTPQSGGEAAIGRWMELARRQDNPSISSITPIYSPASENDVAGHARHIAANAPGISTNTVLDVNNTGQWVDLAKGLFAAESGHPHSEWFTPQEYTNMVQNARDVSGRRVNRR